MYFFKKSVISQTSQCLQFTTQSTTKMIMNKQFIDIKALNKQLNGEFTDFNQLCIIKITVVSKQTMCIIILFHLHQISHL